MEGSVSTLERRPLDELETLSVALGMCKQRAEELLPRVAAMEGGPFPPALIELIDASKMIGYAAHSVDRAHKAIDVATTTTAEEVPGA